MKLNFAVLKNLQQDESGQDLIEYALAAALIALAAVAGMKNVGLQVGTTFTAVSTALTSALG
jgi:pilus assembly protein Flp/PilA